MSGDDTLTQHFQTIYNEHKELNNRIKQASNIILPNSPIPLLSHQIDGCKKLIQILKYSSAALFDEQGLGKTLQTLITLKYFLKSSQFLIIVPNQLIQNWICEIKLFDCFTVTVYNGSKQSRQITSKQCYNSNIILTTHCMLKDPFLRTLKFKIIIVDEIHLFQSTQTQFYKNLIKLQTRRLILLTGTPLQVKLEGLFLMTSIMHKDVHHLIQKIQDFDQSYQQKSSTYSKLFSLIKNQFIRREISILNDKIPDYQELIVYIDQIQNEGSIIQQRRNACSTVTIDNDPIISQQMIDFLILESKSNYFKVKKMLGKFEFLDIQDSYFNYLCSLSKVQLYQAALKIQFPLDKKYFFGSLQPKTEKIIAFLSSCSITKFLIFSQFISHLDVLQHFIPLQVFRIDGNTPNDERTSILTNFKITTEKSVLLLTYPIGNVGLNIIEAKCIIFADFSYNPNEIQQSISRSVRIGQKDSVQVVYFVQGAVENEIFLNVRKQLNRNGKVLKMLSK
ncbi:SNF2 family N-terminal domain-containing protein [Spironucleus salmonicida]|uniref:SNF2 family N-terminal domain-containing protein n=1 Tax=Spironucleus salmonicida TaxID=348837 RepID=V6LAS9_9EUKA|nr:SNF2 family N-terminal domain-containing protein [Spironucleus salmonicida]|eukprot:EST41328.1 SNF2 family N-terminal domain-containing protein [Spironucleus salmonicida]